MSTTDNKHFAINDAFMVWLTEKLNPNIANDVYMALCEADDFLLSNKISTKSIFELNQKKAIWLLASLRRNRIYRYKASFSMEALQRATKLLYIFLKEQEDQTAIDTIDKEFSNITVGDQNNEGKLVEETEELLELNEKEKLLIDSADKAIKSIEARTSEMIPLVKNEELTFSSLFDDEQYSLLRETLVQSGITTIDDLRKINLWTFMNRHSLYNIQTRFKISSELNNKLRQIKKLDTSTSTFSIYYSGEVFIGSTPSEAFIALLSYIATKYPLKFRSCINIIHPETRRVVIFRYNYDGAKLELMCPQVYVDKELTLEEVKLYVEWILQKCTATNPAFEITTDKHPSTAKRILDEPVIPDAIKEQDNLIYAKHIEVKTLPLLALPYIQQAEKYLLEKDLEGATYKELQTYLKTTMINTKNAVAQSSHIIEINRRLYHEEVFVDFKEGADCIEDTLDKLLWKNNGIVTASQLFEYVRIEMPMFLNDNGISDQQQVFDLARHLFEKINYHNKHYCFRSNMYISLPQTAVDSIIDIIKKYAREKGTTFTYAEIENYLTKMGLNTWNLRQRMRIGEEPIFFVYQANEYLFYELIDMDDEFFDHIRKALEYLFEDVGDHVIIRSISKNWYNLLPPLTAGLHWTPMLLQQMLHFYSKQLGARTIMAMDSQDSNTLHAMLVTNDCWIYNFKDAVAAYLYENMPDRTSFEAEELRQVLVRCGMISGNELIFSMPKALSCDPRFLWDSDGMNVSVRL